MVEEDLMDCKEDPMPGQEIWAHYSTLVEGPGQHTLGRSTATKQAKKHTPLPRKCQHPAVNVADLPSLECPPPLPCHYASPWLLHSGLPFI